jgi:hypothetical protein
MTTNLGRDLGHGVRVLPGEIGGLVVQSRSLDLGWRPRACDRPGSAVVFDGASFEVVARETWKHGALWILEPWSHDDAMRVVMPLHESAVNEMAQKSAQSAHISRLRPWMYLFLPILGLAAAPWQRRWRDEWEFPAALATGVSAVLEALLGGCGIFAVITEFGAGESIFPWLPTPLALTGPLLFAEGMIRFVLVASDLEPVGSFLGWAASLFHRPPPPVPQRGPVPSVYRFEDDEGELELLSPVLRRDWEVDGLLPYRGELFRLESTDRIGGDWIYRFGRADATQGGHQPLLRLPPPPPTAGPLAREAGPGMLRLVFLTATTTLAPRRFQERWAAIMGFRPVLLTVVGAGAELVGGIGNLSSGRSGDPLTSALNVYFIAEAIVRLASVVLSGRSMGSVFGLFLVPLLERFLPAE